MEWQQFVQCAKQFHDLFDNDGRIFTRLKASAKNLSAKEELRSLGFCTRENNFLRTVLPTASVPFSQLTITKEQLT